MFAEVNGAEPDDERGAELAGTAEALLAEARVDTIDPGHAVQLATASALLALYWELREHRPGRPARPAPNKLTPADRTPRSRPFRREWASEPGA